MRTYGCFFKVLITAFTTLTTSSAICEELPWRFVGWSEPSPQGPSRLISRFAFGKANSSVFPLNELGIQVWALYEAEMRKQGFLHEEVLSKAPSMEEGLKRLQPLVAKTLGENFFERLPWEVFPSNRYGRMTWEATETEPLAVERIYMEPRGWHELARALDNETELAKISWLPKAAQEGDWKVWRVKTGFTAISSKTKRTLAGFGRDSRDIDQAELEKIIKTLTPAGARP